jgi:hypothetical protein
MALIGVIKKGIIMKNKKSSIGCIIAVLAIAGCTPTVFVNPEYKEQNFKMSNLHIAVVDTLHFNYTGSMDNEFGKDSVPEKVKTFICSTAVKKIADSSTFAVVNQQPFPCIAMEKKKLRWAKNDTITLLVPSDSCTLNADSNDIWLFLQKMQIISAPYVQVIFVGYVPVGAIPHKPLTISSNFVYWDGIKRKPIAWGMASGLYDQGPAVTMENWKRAARRYSLGTLEKTPFKKQSNIKKY